MINLACEAIRRCQPAAAQEHTDELTPLPDIIFDFLVFFHPFSDGCVILWADKAPLVLALGGRKIKIPVITALDWNGDKPTFDGKICLKLSVEGSLGKFG